MPLYQYSGVNQTGKVIRGKMDARNVADLEKRVGRLGLSLISGVESGGKLASVGANLFQKKVTNDELAQFCFYVEQMVGGGVPLLEGLSDVRDSVANPALRNTIGVIIQDIEQGSTLSSAMRQHPKVFDGVFVSLVEAGEFSGELDAVLHNIGDNIKWHDEIVKKTKKAIRYPIAALVRVAGRDLFFDGAGRSEAYAAFGVAGAGASGVYDCAHQHIRFRQRAVAEYDDRGDRDFCPHQGSGEGDSGRGLLLGQSQNPNSGHRAGV